jgi:CSLREA domain-containing protein
MSLSPLLRARVRALLFISICVALVVSVSLLTIWDHASAAPDKGTITPDASTITVNSTADVANSSDGLCTLREAIAAANTNTASGATAGECVAGSSSGSDTINFSVTGAISLTSALPDLTSDMTINGPGANTLTVQRSSAGGTPNFRIFTINLGRTVGISGLTMSNGSITSSISPANCGGAVFNSGTLTLTNSTLSANSSINCGGGIFSNGTLTLLNSTVTGNSATVWGGGVFNNLGTNNLVNSTVSGNQTAGEGGGIMNFNGNITLTNVTVTNNRSDSNNSGAEEGGGLSATGGNALLKNTIVARNFRGSTGTTASDLVSTSSIASSSSFNLIGAGGGGGLTNGVNNNQVGVSNPGLGPLQNNGGPTMTHALLAGSPAFDAGDNSIIGAPLNLSTDQRGAGFNRTVDGNGDGTAKVDIGAYEVQTILVTNLNDSGAGSLRQAITDANASPDTNAINFQIGLTGTITLLTTLPDLSTPLAISTSMAINGPGANQLTVMRSTAGGTSDFRIFTIPQFATASISGLTISNGRLAVNQAGGGVSNRGMLTMTECNVYGNNLSPVNFDAGGGGLFNAGSMTLNKCNIGGTAPGQGNGANGGGAGISEIGTLVMTGGSIVGNSGTGINVGQGGATLINVNISNNAVSSGTGGVFVSGGVTLTNCLISNNSVVGFGGGGIDVEGGSLNAVNTTISGNTTGQGGGGIRQANNGVTHLVNATITNNRSDSNNSGGERGGGIDNSFGTVTLANTIVAGNYRGGSPSTTADDINGVVDSSSSFDLIGAGGSGGLTNGVNNNQAGVADPKLGLLTDNGGLTMTHSLLLGSPAIDTGSNANATNAGLTTDQRGFARFIDGPDADTTATVDIGAYETQAALADIANVSTNEDTQVQTVFDAGDTSNIISITATSSNPLVPNDVAHLSVNGFGSTEVVTIVPATNLNGTTSITITVNRTGGGSASKTFLLTVNSVNDAPSFTKGADQPVNEDAGPQTVTNWATNISTGPADESVQTLTFQVTNNSNAALFSSAPAISPTGTLSYTPATNANGSATITIVLKDNGGTANSGVDTSAPQTFTITVNSVNDPPSFTKGADQTVNNNAGAQTVANWATNISAGPADESSQTVTFQITGNSNPSLFTVAPSISSTGTLTYTPAANAGGTSTITLVLKDNGGTANGGQDTSPAQTFNINVTAIGGSLSFNSPTYGTTESSGSTTITVKRTGDLSRAVAVDYATSGDTGVPCSTPGAASPKCDFTSALGTLKFAAGEDTKTFTVLISQDSFVEGSETFTVTLSNQTGGAALATPATATVTIADDVSEPSTNAIDDASNFVRQNYHDFLNREPDASGLAFWTNQITSCGSDQECIELRRINVSAAFFLSIEFQGTGYLVERLYKTSYGDVNGASTFGGAHQLPVPVVRFNEFLPDTQEIGQGVIVGQPGWEMALENNKQAFVAAFLQRTRFVTALPTSRTPTQFVDQLNTNAGNVLSASEKATAIGLFGSATDTSNVTVRAQALRQIAEDADLNSAEFNRAFVLMQYFGYMRRNPNDPQDADYSGFDFWLTKLNQFNGNFVNADMVKAFITAGEYRQHFGP